MAARVLKAEFEGFSTPQGIPQISTSPGQSLTSTALASVPRRAFLRFRRNEVHTGRHARHQRFSTPQGIPQISTRMPRFPHHSGASFSTPQGIPQISTNQVHRQRHRRIQSFSTPQGIPQISTVHHHRRAKQVRRQAASVPRRAFLRFRLVAPAIASEVEATVARLQCPAGHSSDFDMGKNSVQQMTKQLQYPAGHSSDFDRRAVRDFAGRPEQQLQYPAGHSSDFDAEWGSTRRRATARERQLQYPAGHSSDFDG